MSAGKENSLLIIDDDKMNLKVLSNLLSPDYTIYTATNGANGIRIAKEHLPDLILLDILMPEMDGYQTLAEMRKNEETRKIPVIFITGLDSEQDEEKGLAFDAVDYITKPFRATIVKLRVQNQMQIVNHLRTIEYLCMHDHLTKIPNRRCFDERLNMEWNNAIREQKLLSILMIDLDNFKKLNDVYGHQQGDIVLQAIAKTFPEALKRPRDFVARWGGEEFTVLLPDTPMPAALDIAEKIRVNVQDTEFPCADGSAVSVTISIGVHSCMPAQGDLLEQFVSNADSALYAAKQSGKNRVHHFSGSAACGN